MDIKETKEILETILEYNLTSNKTGDFADNIIPHLVSLPGIGKTSIVEAVTKEKDWYLYTIPIASYDAAEIAGFPMLDKENKKYDRAKPFWLDTPTDKPVVLFFDEISQAPTANVNVLAMLVNERKIGEHKLNDNVMIVCAGNAMSHRAGTNPLPSHFKDRVTFLEVEPDLEAFMSYANSKKLHEYIVGFLRNRPSFLSMFDPKIDSCPSPRSWMRVNTILKMGMPYKLRNQAIKGQVGEAAQADFLGYLRVADKIPDPQLILSGECKDIPEDNVVMYALCAALSTLVTTTTARHFVNYLSILPNKEFAAFTIRDALQRDKKLKANKYVTSWFMSEGKTLLL